MHYEFFAYLYRRAPYLLKSILYTEVKVFGTIFVLYAKAIYRKQNEIKKNLTAFMNKKLKYF